MAREITEKQIEKRFGPVYFERGLEYYESGNIIDPVFYGDRLEACCEGSTPEPYRLSATLKAGGIADNRCSCPLGGDCKHVIALLLTGAHDRKRFLDLAGLEKRLGEKPKEELITIITRLLEKNPALAFLIQEPASRQKGRKTAVDPETYRARIRNAMSRYGGWRTMGMVADAIGSVMEAAAAFLKNKDFKNARIVYDALIRETLDNYESVQDEGEISMEIDAAAEALAGCLAKNENDKDERLKIVETLFEIIRWDITQGGYGMGEDVPKILSRKTTADERTLVKTWSIAALKADASEGHKEEWGRFLKALYDADGDDGGFLALAERCHLYELLFDKLVELKNASRALETARARLTTSAWKRLQACERLARAGFHSEAVAFAEEAFPGCKDDGLKEWLAEKYVKGGEFGKALELYSQRWKSRPDLEVYKNMKKTAGALKTWSALRKELVQGLEAKNDFELLTRVCLSEKDLAAAWGYAEKIKNAWLYPGGLIHELAGASEKSFPEKSIAVYKKTARKLIDGRKRGDYRAACGFLKRIIKIYSQTGQAPSGKKLISDFRETYANLPALQNEMTRAGL